MKRLFLSFVAAIMVVLPAQADEDVSGDDAVAIREVIESQLDAFKRDDGNEAFGYAAPAIQNKFQSVDIFMEMVRTGYPAVYRSIDASFEAPRKIGETTIQEVVVTGQTGASFLAVYTMEQQADGSWRINGCSLFPVPDVQV